MSTLLPRGVTAMQKLEACIREFEGGFYLKDYSRAENGLRAGLTVAVQAFSEAELQPGDWFHGTAFLRRTAAVTAALAGDSGLLDQMKHLAEVVGYSDEEVARGFELLHTMSVVRSTVEAVGTTTLRELVNTNPDIGPDPYRAVEWLSKNRELALERRDGELVISWGHATEQPRAMPSNFRVGAELVLSTPLDMSGIAPPHGEERWSGGVFYSVEEAEEALPTPTAPSSPVPSSQRLTSPMRTLALASVTWLVGTTKTQGGVNFTTEVVIKDLDGASTNHIVLDHDCARAFTSSDLNHALFLDKAGTVFAYDEHGRQLARISLTQSPEYRSFPTEPRLWAVDIDVNSETLVFSLNNGIYRFTFDGEPVSVVSLPFYVTYVDGWDDDRPHGSIPGILEKLGRRAALTVRQAASIFREPVMPDPRSEIARIRHDVPELGDGSRPVAVREKDGTALRRLWIAMQFPRMDYVHCLALSRNDDTLYVASHSGLLLHLSPGGLVLESWLIPSHPKTMRQLDDGTLVVANDAALALVKPGHPPLVVDDVPGAPTATGRFLVKRANRTFRVIDLATGTASIVRLGAAFRATYERGETLVLESTTQRYEVEGA